MKKFDIFSIKFVWSAEVKYKIDKKFAANALMMLNKRNP